MRNRLQPVLRVAGGRHPAVIIRSVIRSPPRVPWQRLKLPASGRRDPLAETHRLLKTLPRGGDQSLFAAAPGGRRATLPGPDLEAPPRHLWERLW